MKVTFYQRAPRLPALPSIITFQFEALVVSLLCRGVLKARFHWCESIKIQLVTPLPALPWEQNNRTLTPLDEPSRSSLTLLPASFSSCVSNGRRSDLTAFFAISNALFRSTFFFSRSAISALMEAKKSSSAFARRSSSPSLAPFCSSSALSLNENEKLFSHLYPANLTNNLR